MPHKGKKTKVTGSSRKQIKKLAKKLVEKKLTLALSHYPPQLNY
jgi:hypothetical protein